MTTADGSTLLTDAPTGRHFAQFHRHTEGQDRRRDTLTESALEFVEAGLRRGDSVVVIAESDQRDRLFVQLPRLYQYLRNAYLARSGVGGGHRTEAGES